MSDVVKCAHGYGLLRDSCPGCDNMIEYPHKAEPVTVTPSWSKTPITVCRLCALKPDDPHPHPNGAKRF